MIDNFKRLWRQELWRRCEKEIGRVANYYHVSKIDNRLLITLDRELPWDSLYNSVTMQYLCSVITVNAGIITKKVSDISFEILLDSYFKVDINDHKSPTYETYEVVLLNKITTLHNTKRINEYPVNFETYVIEEFIRRISDAYGELKKSSKIDMIRKLKWNHTLVFTLQIPTQYYERFDTMQKGLELAKTMMKVWGVNMRCYTGHNDEDSNSIEGYTLHSSSSIKEKSYALEITNFTINFPIDSDLVTTTFEILNSDNEANKELAKAGIYDEPYNYMVNPFHQQLFKTLFHELP